MTHEDYNRMKWEKRTQFYRVVVYCLAAPDATLGVIVDVIGEGLTRKSAIAKATEFNMKNDNIEQKLVAKLQSEERHEGRNHL